MSTNVNVDFRGEIILMSKKKKTQYCVLTSNKSGFWTINIDCLAVTTNPSEPGQ